MALTYVEVRDTVLRADQSPATGYYLFAPSGPITNGTTSQTADAIRADIQPDGTVSVQLAAGDDADTDPAGLAYNIIRRTTQTPDGPLVAEAYSIQVNAADAANGIDLAERATVETLPPLVKYALSVADVDVDPLTGDVPLTAADIKALPTAGGTVTGQLKAAPTSDLSASTSTGGAVNVDNTGSTGAGLVAYSAQAAPAGHLIVARANNATFNQSALYATYVGTGHAVTVNHNGTGQASSALNVASTNPDNSAVGVSGKETGKGTIKVTHTGSGTDVNASGLSVNLAGAGTAAQGIYVDATDGGTTGDLLRLRNNSVDKFTVSADGGPGFYGAAPVAKPTVSGSLADGSALASLLNALATLGLITDTTTA